jgi:phosphatidylinositol-bisphosphatase
VNSNGQPIADIYVVGFQEMVDLTVVNVAVDSKSQQRSQFWQDRITETLALKGGRYTHVHSKYLVGLLLCVYVKESVMPFVKDVRSTTVGVGVMGVMGNKGGVCIRMTYYNSSICLVCTHLAAHMENISGRNGDFKNIYEKAVFQPTEAGIAAMNAANESYKNDKNRQFHYTTGLSGAQDCVMDDHDLIFWIGDLNYRIDDNFVTMEEVFQRISNKDYNYLLQYDQLNMERNAGNVFENFNEGQITFAPTYKYQPGTNDYDRRPEKKQRPPAWCDRILWRSLSNKLDSVIQLDYTRSELQPSDHKPVMSLFQVSIRKIIAEKEKAVFQELIKILDKWENDSIPRVETEGTNIDFGTLYFQVIINLYISLHMYLFICCHNICV